MKLLIKRDPTKLVPTKGKVELDSDVPNFLKGTHSVNLRIRDSLEERSGDDLFISNPQDYEQMNSHLNSSGVNGSVPAVWSGYRSVLVSDGDDGLYKLKGVSLNPKSPECRELGDGTFDVFGAQWLRNARYEKQMSDKFNAVLREEGIEPVMECKGFWHYPKKVRGQELSASVVRVQGDTRLDEFMFLVEQYIYHNNEIFKGKQLSIESKPFVERHDHFFLSGKLNAFYHDIGFAVGNLKKLMDKNNQTWSSDHNQTNAHLGNVVLYNGTDKVKVGFVDFDASCDANDFSLSKIKELQEREYNNLMNCAMAGPISLRRINAKYKIENAAYEDPRKSFQQGFQEGYSTWRIGRTRNEIDLSRFVELVEWLRLPEILKKFLVQPPSETSLFIEDKYRDKKIDDLYEILDRNRIYQKGDYSLEDIIRNRTNILDKGYPNF